MASPPVRPPDDSRGEQRDPRTRTTLRHILTGLGIASLVILAALVVLMGVIAVGFFLLYLACSGH